MTVRRSHYELAFEKFLDRRGTPYVAIEDVRHFTKERTGTKAFDYIVYPQSGRACLVDVKGRKTTATGGADCRQKNWVTEADVSDLLTWQEVFGPDYEAVFVFSYWLAGAAGEPSPSEEDLPEASFCFAGRRYSYWIASVAEYAKHQRGLSVRWKTVSIPRDVFRQISRRLEVSWPPAPC